ncbi:hypothetical protein QYF61_026594 [Mycteria americana]|uniref:Uncharacterized protein n=1 Tax=Mycteria americana TaxID=33587 RepID=A0AAN7S4Q8_MYCAM|nr:hypothetical protein QYF61_026594 [Mycteria americana]
MVGSLRTGALSRTKAKRAIQPLENNLVPDKRCMARRGAAEHSTAIHSGGVLCFPQLRNNIHAAKNRAFSFFYFSQPSALLADGILTPTWKNMSNFIKLVAQMTALSMNFNNELNKTNFGIYLMNQPLCSSFPDILSVGSQVLPVLEENTEIQPPTSSEEKCSG